MSWPTAYVFRDADGCVLYVGATSDPLRRIREHEKRASWFSDVAAVTFYPATSWEQAHAIEVALIEDLTPRHNVQHNAKETAMSVHRPELMSVAEAAAAYEHFKALEADELAQAEKVRQLCLDLHRVDLAAVKAAS